MKKFLLVTIVIFISVIGNTQNLRKGINFSFNPKAVANFATIVWYGFDLRYSHMLDHKRFSESEIIVKTHIPGIQTVLEEYYNDKVIKRLVDKLVVFNDMPTIHDLTDNMIHEGFISRRNVDLQIEDVKSIVKEYTLPAIQGLGVVIIIEMFNKTEKYVSGFVTFFDIESREVLHSTRISGEAGYKYGFNKYWANGIINLTQEFFQSSTYRKLNKIK